MKVALLGATGFVGKVLLRRLIDAGHQVAVLARSPDKLGDMAQNVTVVEGDFFTQKDVDKAIEGSEVVMSTIGPSRDEMSAAFAANCVVATQHLIRSMEERGPKRFIFMAGAGMPFPGEHLHPRRRLMAYAIKMIARKAWEGKVAEMADAFSSSLDITVIRPPRIKKTSAGRLHVHETTIGGTSVGVGHVADFMADLLRHPNWIGKAPVVWS